MSTVAELLVKIGGDSSGLRKELAASQRQIKRAFGSEALGASQAAIASIGALAISMGIAGAASIKMASDFETARTAFTTLMNSGEKADKMLNDLATFAADTPFELPGLIKASKMLMAFQFDAQDIIPIMSAVGNAISLVGGGQEAIDGVVRALGQIQAKGKLSAEEMNQLAERGINGWKYIADSMGISIAQVMDLCQKGAIDSTTAINAVVLGMQTNFAGGMDSMSKTIPGLMSTIKDNAELVMTQIGKELSEALNIKGILTEVANDLTTFATTVKQVGLKDAINGMFPPEAVASVFAFSGALAGAGVAAMVAFGIATWTAMAPLLPFIAAGAALGLLAYEIWKNWEPLTEYFTASWETISNVVTMAWDDISSACDNACNYVSELIDDTWNSVSDGTTSVWDSICQFFGGIWDSIVSYANENCGWLVDAIASAWNFVCQITTDTWNGAIKLISDAWNYIKDIVAAGVNWIIEKMNALLSFFNIGVPAGVSKYFDAFSNGLEKMKNSVLEIDIGFNKKELPALKTPEKPNKNFTGLHGKPQATSTPAPTGSNKSSERKSSKSKVDKEAKELEKLEKKADQVSKSIEKQWIQLTGTKMDALEEWKSDEISKLNESASVNENYQRDLSRLNEIYAEKKKKILLDQQKDTNSIWDSTYKDAIDAQRKLNSIGMSDVDKQKTDISSSAIDQIEEIKKHYRDLTLAFESSTKEQQTQYKNAWTANGIIFEEIEGGKVSFVEEQAKRIQAIEAEKEQKLKDLHYDRIKYQEDIDKAYSDGDLVKYQEVLNTKQAMIQNDLKSQQEMCDLYKTIWEAANTSVTSSYAKLGTNVFDSMKSGISEMLMMTKSFGEVWSSIGQTIQKTIADMISQWIAGKVAMAIFGKSSLATETAASAAAGATTAAAWAPAATMVSLATFGANSGPAMAGIAATSALSTGLSIPGLATGGITTGSTLAEIGEGHYQEAVLPLNRKTFEKTGLINSEEPNVTPNFNINISALDGRSVKQTFDRHGDKMINSLMNQYRKFNFGGAN